MRLSLRTYLRPYSALFLASTSIASAQTLPQRATPLTRTGKVLDPSGAAIPHAHLIFQHLNDVTAQVEANESEAFQLIFLKPGDYRITVSAAGFNSSTIAESTAVMPNSLAVTLQIAARAEIVEVEGDGASTIQPFDTQLGGVINESQLAALALNGRSFTNLLALNPGVVPTSSAQPNAVVMSGVASIADALA